MRSRSLLSQYSVKPYQVCPVCNSKYVVDRATRRRLWLIVVVALLTFASSAAAWSLGFPWGLVPFISGAGLLIYTGFTVSRMEYVEYRE